MTPEQIEIVRKSFDGIMPLHGQVANSFYNHLFESAPESRGLFSDDMSEQKRKFEVTLSFIVEALDRQEELEKVATDLARKHLEYGTLPEHYALVGMSLLHALKMNTQNGLTKKESTAWLAVYAWLSDIMLKVYTDCDDF